VKSLHVYKWCDGEWYDTDEADAVIRELEAELAAALRGRVHVRIPTDAMEQEFATHYRRGFEAGRKQAEAERDAARAEVTALQFRVDQQRILAGFGDTDLRLAREQRDTAYRILRRIAGYRREHFASVYDMADACVYEAVAGVGEQEDSDAD
jgi:thiamine pyrophosphate-dependent acetolactate synthase large subunit-like protein